MRKSTGENEEMAGGRVGRAEHPRGPPSKGYPPRPVQMCGIFREAHPLWLLSLMVSFHCLRLASPLLPQASQLGLGRSGNKKGPVVEGECVQIQLGAEDGGSHGKLGVSHSWAWVSSLPRLVSRTWRPRS